MTATTTRTRYVNREELARNTAEATENIARVAPDTYIVPSRRVTGRVYRVTQRNAEWLCNCDADYHGLRCWHVKAVEERIDAQRPKPQIDDTTRAAAMAMLMKQPA